MGDDAAVHADQALQMLEEASRIEGLDLVRTMLRQRSASTSAVAAAAASTAGSEGSLSGAIATDATAAAAAAAAAVAAAAATAASGDDSEEEGEGVWESTADSARVQWLPGGSEAAASLPRTVPMNRSISGHAILAGAASAMQREAAASNGSGGGSSGASHGGGSGSGRGGAGAGGSVGPISPALLPLRVGGPRVMWQEIDVSSPEAFQRVVITGTNVLGDEQQDACQQLHRAMQLRNKHLYRRGDYYWGQLAHADFPHAPMSREPPPRNEMGTPIALRPPTLRHAALSGLDGHVGFRAGHATSTSSSAFSGISEPATPARPRAPQPSQPPPPPVPGSPVMQKLFFRRRPEPHFVPFQNALLPRAELQYSFVEGVLRFFELPPAAGTLKAAQPLPARSPRDSDGLHGSGSSGAFFPAGATATAATAARGSAGGPSGASASAAGHIDGSSSTNLFRIGEETPFSPEALEIEGDDSSNARAASELASPRALFVVPSWREFSADYAELLAIVHKPSVKTFTFRRLELLAARFRLHAQLNGERESQEQKAVPHRDFYNVRKVDTHVHHSACMNQKHLLRFIKSKLRKEPDSVVIRRDGRDLTLAQVFESLNLTAYDLSIDTLDMHADASTFHRFDRFNTKYNPQGSSRLREIFLKTDNLLQGRFLAEITREVFDDLSASKYQLAEYRLSIYGRAKSEWRKLAAWVVGNRLAEKEVRWMIQIPRLYEIYIASGQIASFQDMLDNIFLPLVEVSLDPAVDPVLHQFLGLVVGFDSVDDESRPEIVPAGASGGGGSGGGSGMPLPKQWTGAVQPPYHYWTYFLAANVAVVNGLRASRGLSQFAFRPHAGEAGEAEHLAATFLTAESINHGINLRKSPSLQYLYYLAQIGLAMSPLSNNKLFLDYTKNPFAEFFAKGLNVSLSTDDPLMLALTKEPLLEEYAVASQVFKLSSADMCEIARNSVLQSGFEYPHKAHFLGPNFAEAGPDGNDIHYSNVPYIRLQFRHETLRGELELLRDAVSEGREVAEPELHLAAAAPMHRSASVAPEATGVRQVIVREGGVRR